MSIQQSSKTAGVIIYESGNDFITVRFKEEFRRTYTFNSCGQETVNLIKLMARSPETLWMYICENNPHYEVWEYREYEFGTLSEAIIFIHQD